MSVPTAAQRLALQQHPERVPVMRQRWSNLLFLHWQVSPELVQSRLPSGLSVDLFGGQAWLGVVPFSMERVRPVGLPPLPRLSWFLELNVRTYVHDQYGNPGVWFFSLDCNLSLAVRIARSFFHLPYEPAEMRVWQEQEMTHYHCQRRTSERAANYSWSPGASAIPAKVGSLEFFEQKGISCSRQIPVARYTMGGFTISPISFRFPKRRQSHSFRCSGTRFLR